jgi:hypothetical protein
MADTPQHNCVAELLNCRKVSSSVLLPLQLTDTSTTSSMAFSHGPRRVPALPPRATPVLPTLFCLHIWYIRFSLSCYLTHVTSRPRSPSRPLSDNTITTGDTVTPKKFHSRTSRASRARHQARQISPHLINDSGIGVNEPLIAYDLRVPPPPLSWHSRPRPKRSGDQSRSLASDSPWLPGPARQRRQGRRTNKSLPLHHLRKTLPAAPTEYQRSKICSESVR